MRVKIYQINSDRDSQRIKFLGKEDLQKLKGISEIDASLYDKVFEADIEKTDLENIYRIFNTIGHPLFRGHSLSVSDVVVNDEGAFFCNDFGFKKIDFDESKTQISSDTYRIVYVEPNKPAYATEIGTSLNSFKSAVNGSIETFNDTDDETCYVLNREGKISGMEGNRHLSDGKGIIAGPFLVIGTDGDTFRSLNNDEIEMYIEKFSKPEAITQVEVQNDMGFRVTGFEQEM